VSFGAVTLYVTSQRVFIVVVVYFVIDQSGNFWIYSRIFCKILLTTKFQGLN
jgi:hypothetical protein